MGNANEMRDFLVSRRARITPEQAGLPAFVIGDPGGGIPPPSSATTAGRLRVRGRERAEFLAGEAVEDLAADGQGGGGRG